MAISVKKKIPLVPLIPLEMFASAIRRSLNPRFVEYRVKGTLEGGREVVVQNARVNTAFNVLNRLCEEGQVRALSKRSRYYVKPKHRRQQMEQEYHDRKRSAAFREKLAAAYELMKSGY